LTNFSNRCSSNLNLLDHLLPPFPCFPFNSCEFHHKWE
jgi:hypothetical protein